MEMGDWAPGEQADPLVGTLWGSTAEGLQAPLQGLRARCSQSQCCRPRNKHQ